MLYLFPQRKPARTLIETLSKSKTLLKALYICGGNIPFVELFSDRNALK